MLALTPLTHHKLVQQQTRDSDNQCFRHKTLKDLPKSVIAPSKPMGALCLKRLFKDAAAPRVIARAQISLLPQVVLVEQGKPMLLTR